MLYTVSLDKDNYITAIGHTANDNIDLNLDEIVADYLNAYQLIDGKVVLDKKKKAKIIAENEEEDKQMQIMALTELLHESDEDMLDFLERLFSFKNPLTFISDMISLMKKYSTLVANRQQIRKEIKEKMK